MVKLTVSNKLRCQNSKIKVFRISKVWEDTQSSL